MPEDGLYKTLCFHAQQAVEKSLKAVLVLRGVEFPKSHSLSRLIDLLPANIERDESLVESAKLTAYATTFRYPTLTAEDLAAAWAYARSHSEKFEREIRENEEA